MQVKFYSKSSKVAFAETYRVIPIHAQPSGKFFQKPKPLAFKKYDSIQCSVNMTDTKILKLILLHPELAACKKQGVLHTLKLKNYKKKI